MGEVRSILSRAAVLVGAAMALGMITATTAAAVPAMAGISSSSHHVPNMAGNSAYNHLSKAAQERLISSPLGMHTPKITSRLCSSTTPSWVTLHINYLSGDGYRYYCFGGRGTWYFPSNVIAWACSGNNNGTFAWYPGSGGMMSRNFGAGWTWSFLAGADADYITINGWSGSYNC